MYLTKKKEITRKREWNTDNQRCGRQRWYRHVMRREDEDQWK